MERADLLSPRRRAAALAVAALAVAAALALRIETARHEATGVASSCTISERIDCDRVQASSHAKVLGVSLSVWGGAGAAITALWILGGGATLLRAAGALAVFQLVVSLFYFYVSWFEIGAVCLYCSVLQACNLALALLLAPPAWRVRAPLERRPLLRGALVAAAVLALGVAGDASATARAQLRRLFVQPEGAKLRVDVADAMVLGNPETRLSVLLYFDFGCPICEGCYHKAKGLVRRHPDEVHFIFKNWPLDKTCNETLVATTHAGSCRAARAGQAAALRGRTPPALEYLFGIEEYYPQLLAKLGQQLGVPPDEWAALQESAEVESLLRRDVAEGNALNLGGVPAIYINGHPVDPSRLEQRVERLIGR